jgi:hypothetical protein
MALVNPSSLTFEDIRLILCVHGYTLENKFICREIGYWSRNGSGVIPFSCRVNPNRLNSKDRTTLRYLTKNFHGIDIRKQLEIGLLQNEIRSVIRTLYLMSDDDNNRKYIGICRDINVFTLCCSSGFQYLTINLENMNNISSESRVPTNDDLLNLMENKYNPYKICKIHNNLDNGKPVLCAGTKAKFLADYFIKSISELNKNIK